MKSEHSSTLNQKTEKETYYYSKNVKAELKSLIKHYLKNSKNNKKTLTILRNLHKSKFCLRYN